MDKRIARVGCALVLVILAFLVWYTIAANYDYGALSGTYSFHFKGEMSTLVLKKDHSFQQELTHDGKLEHAQGRWRRVGEGGVVFSKEFMKLAGQKVRPDGQADAEVEKTLGLFASIHFDPAPSGPVFRKSYFHQAKMQVDLHTRWCFPFLPSHAFVLPAKNAMQNPGWITLGLGTSPAAWTGGYHRIL
jgi:4-amino-4-deoxy-L-arabinose transferase-like glycosyltransferase